MAISFAEYKKRMIDSGKKVTVIKTAKGTGKVLSKTVYKGGKVVSSTVPKAKVISTSELPKSVTEKVSEQIVEKIKPANALSMQRIIQQKKLKATKVPVEVIKKTLTKKKVEVRNALKKGLKKYEEFETKRLENWADQIVERGKKLDKKEAETFKKIDDKYLQVRYAIDEFFPKGTKTISKIGSKIFEFGEEFLQGSISTGARATQAGEKAVFLSAALGKNLQSGSKDTKNFFKELVTGDAAKEVKRLYKDPKTYKDAALGAAVAVVLGAGKTKATSVKKLPKSGAKAPKGLKAGKILKDAKGNRAIVKADGKVLKLPKSLNKKLFDKNYISKSRTKLKKIFKKKPSKVRKIEPKLKIKKEGIKKRQVKVRARKARKAIRKEAKLKIKEERISQAKKLERERLKLRKEQKLTKKGKEPKKRLSKTEKKRIKAEAKRLAKEEKTVRIVIKKKPIRIKLRKEGLTKKQLKIQQKQFRKALRKRGRAEIKRDNSILNELKRTGKVREGFRVEVDSTGRARVFQLPKKAIPKKFKKFKSGDKTSKKIRTARDIIKEPKVKPTKSGLVQKSKIKKVKVSDTKKVVKPKSKARTKPKSKAKTKPKKAIKEDYKTKSKIKTRVKKKSLSKNQIKNIGKSIRLSKLPKIGIAALKARLAYRPELQGRNITPANIKDIKDIIDKRIDDIQKKDIVQKKIQDKKDDQIKKKINEVIEDVTTASSSVKKNIQDKIFRQIQKQPQKRITKEEIKLKIPLKWKLKKKTKKKKGRTQGYNVLVREKARKIKYKGKTKRIPSKTLKVTKRSLSKGRAERLLIRALDDTTAQTGRIKKSKTLVKKRKTPVKASFKKFRRSKSIKNAITEKRKHAIDTRGEKRGITVKGWIAKRTKKRKSSIKKKKPLNKAKRKVNKNARKKK